MKATIKATVTVEYAGTDKINIFYMPAYEVPIFLENSSANERKPITKITIELEYK